MFHRRLNITEIFLIQAIVYTLLWLWNDYVATLLSLTFSAIAFFILAVSLISELLDRSKVPRWYFSAMIISVVTPLIIGSFFMILKKGALDWYILSVCSF